MNLNGFEEMEQPTPKQYEYNQKEVSDAIMGNREAFKPQSKMFNNNSTNSRIRELQEKETEGTLTTEEAGELFNLALGLNGE